jgi:hypothetical protein
MALVVEGRRALPAVQMSLGHCPSIRLIQGTRPNINLDNGVQMTASDGEARLIGAGEVLLVEDTTGKGHLSKAVNERLRHGIFVTLD